jgi:UDP-N-acetyl-2-amino-2-deoxyglucuronate dehydrogenase
MKPLRFGIAGTGGIAGLHAKCLRQLELLGIAVLVAGADTKTSHAASYSKTWDVPVHETIEELVARDDIDAVTVCSPSGLHCDHAILAMNAGKHVLIEKPMDLQVSKALAAIEASTRNNVTLGCIFNQRFAAGPLKVKKAVEGGYFGDIIYAHCETPWFRDQAYYDSAAWRGTWALDCGVLANQGPHMLDRLLWICGDVEEVLSATCDVGSHRNIEAETNAAAIVRFANGALGTITGSTLVHGSLPQRTLICGTEGSACIAVNTLTSFDTKRPFVYDDAAMPESEAGNGGANPLDISEDSHRLNIADFATAVSEGRKPSVTGEDGFRLVRLLSGIYSKAGVGPYAS